MKHTDKKADYQFGISIFILLAFLTVAEYLIAVEFTSTIVLFTIAFAKAVITGVGGRCAGMARGR